MAIHVNANVNAYVITIEDPRSEKLLSQIERLNRIGFDAHLVQGIKGSELSAGDYFKMTRHWRATSGRELTPGELGCTLSHQRALRMAAHAESAGNLILEDDFIASDAALEIIYKIGLNPPARTLFHLGGQEGLERSLRFVRGHMLDSETGVFEIDAADLQFLMRTVAYLVDSQVAQSLEKLIDDGPFLIDDFAYSKSHFAFDKVWFRGLVSHPTDLVQSAIERERLSLTGKPKNKISNPLDCLGFNERRRRKLLWIWRRLSTPSARFLVNQHQVFRDK